MFRKKTCPIASNDGYSYTPELHCTRLSANLGTVPGNREDTRENTRARHLQRTQQNTSKQEEAPSLEQQPTRHTYARVFYVELMLMRFVIVYLLFVLLSEIFWKVPFRETSRKHTTEPLREPVISTTQARSINAAYKPGIRKTITNNPKPPLLTIGPYLINRRFGHLHRRPQTGEKKKKHDPRDRRGISITPPNRKIKNQTAKKSMEQTKNTHTRYIGNPGINGTDSERRLKRNPFQ